jgi:phage tail-like protein
MAVADRPLSAFNFSVEIVPDGTTRPLCSAAFSECDGLEMTLDVKTIREGGNNGVQIKLVGAAGYGQLALKRGMTEGFELWRWFEQVVASPSLRATAHVVVLDPEAAAVRPRATFLLTRCVPLKLKAPALNAREGIVAVEELQLGYESLRVLAGAGRG